MYIHPTYVATNSTFNTRVDLAMIYTQQTITLNSQVGSVSLASPSCTQCESVGAQYVVSGYGDTSSSPTGSSNPSDALLYAYQQFVTLTQCQQAATSFTLPLSTLCAGPISGQTGTDSCQGDSGGPLAYATSSSSWVVAGVVSTGTAVSGGSQPLCGGTGQYGIYVSVRSYYTWLSATLTQDASVASDRVTTGTGADASLAPAFQWYYIVAIVVGVVLLILIIVACCCCCKRNRHHNASKQIRSQPIKATPNAPINTSGVQMYTVASNAPQSPGRPPPRPDPSAPAPPPPVPAYTAAPSYPMAPPPPVQNNPNPYAPQQNPAPYAPQPVLYAPPPPGATQSPYHQYGRM